VHMRLERTRRWRTARAARAALTAFSRKAPTPASHVHSQEWS